MNNYKISILLSAYNCEKYIAEAIQSLLNQTYTNFELLIADDCSSDNTRKIIDSFTDPRIITHHNSTNLKKPQTINKLFSFATGNLVTIHDGDDVSLPNRFEKIVAIFQEKPNIYMCGHIIQRMTEDGQRLELFRPKKDSFEEIQKDMLHTNTDGDPSMVFKYEVVNQIGGVLRDFFTNSMDYDLALRIIEKYESTNILEVLSLYRNVPNSISKGVLSSRKMIMPKMAQFFAQERKEKGIDSLELADWNTIKIQEEIYLQPYTKDKTLHLKEMAAAFMHLKMYKTAIAYAWKSVQLAPFSLENWRTFQYCVRKTLLSF